MARLTGLLLKLKPSRLNFSRVFSISCPLTEISEICSGVWLGAELCSELVSPP